MLFLFVILLFFHYSLADCPPGAINVSSSFGSNWSCILVYPSTYEFTNAEEECNTNGGHLVSVPNGFFNYFLACELLNRLRYGNSNKHYSNCYECTSQRKLHEILDWSD